MQDETTKSFCDGCHIRFGTHEKRVVMDNLTLHEDCEKKVRRRIALQNFFRADREVTGLVVQPRHHFGRR